MRTADVQALLGPGADADRIGRAMFGPAGPGCPRDWSDIDVRHALVAQMLHDDSPWSWERCVRVARPSRVGHPYLVLSRRSVTATADVGAVLEAIARAPGVTRVVAIASQRAVRV